MKNLKHIAVRLILLSSLFLAACDGTYTSDTKSSITIDGYVEDWTSLVGDDSRRTFKDFPKRVPLPGYSEEGEIFITYRDTPQNGIPFTYSEVGSYPQKYKLLEFYFGDRRETLQCKADY